MKPYAIPAFVVLPLIMLAAIACGGGSSPPPDIDATVEARVQAELATEATVEARVQDQLAKAMPTGTLIPTAIPTHTPTPTATPTSIPTPTPTPTPVPLSSLSILEKSVEAMTKLKSFRYEVEAEFRSGGFSLPVTTVYDFQSPHTVTETSSIRISSEATLQFEYLMMDENYYEKQVGGNWTRTAEFEGQDIGEDWLEEDGVLNWPIDIEVVEDALDGKSVYRFVWDQSEMLNSQNYLDVLKEIKSEGEWDMDTEIRNARVEYWIDSETYYFRRAKIYYELSSSDSTFAGLPLESDFVELSGEVNVSKFNEPIPVVIEPSIEFPSTSSILEKSLQAMTELESFHHVIKMEVKSGEFELPIGYEGDFQSPNSIKQTMSIKMFGLDVASELIKIGDRFFEKEPMGEWFTADGFSGIDPTDFWMEDDNFLSLPLSYDPTIANLDGFEVYYIRWDLSGDLSEGGISANFLSLLDVNDENMPNSFLVEYWIDTETHHLRNFKVTLEADADDSGFSDMPLGSDIVNISMDFRFSLFDEPVDQITAPAALLSN